MILENQVLQFRNQNFDQRSLTELQRNYLSHLMSGSTIYQMVQTLLQHGWLVNFKELYQLVQFLVQYDIISNKDFLHLWNQYEAAHSVQFQKSMASGANFQRSQNSYQLSKYAFFRSLNPALLQEFERHAEVVQVPAGSLITEQGSADRDFYILVKGRALVYKKQNDGQRLLISSLNEGSVFGEVGFLLGQPRTADIVTQSDCQLIQIKFNTTFFEKHIKKEMAQSLQHRFWVLHSLSQSPLFKNLPDDVFDQMIFSGELRKTGANQLLFREGDPGTSCMIIVQGSVVISQNGKTINVLNQGDCLGEIALFYSGGRRTAQAHTQRETVLMVIEQNKFYAIMAQNIVLGKELQKLAEARLLNDQKR